MAGKLFELPVVVFLGFLLVAEQGYTIPDLAGLQQDVEIGVSCVAKADVLEHGDKLLVGLPMDLG